jgi:hypothetical protein
MSSAPNFWATYRTTLQACWALKWRLAIFIIIFSGLMSGIWIAYFGFMYDLLSPREAIDVKDAALIIQYGNRGIGAFAFLFEQGILCLLLYFLTMKGQKSVWIGLKRFTRGWRAFSVYALLFAAASAAGLFYSIQVAENKPALYVSFILQRSVNYSLFFMFLITLVKQSGMPQQASNRGYFNSVAILRIFSQILALATLMTALGQSVSMAKAKMTSMGLNLLSRAPLFALDGLVTSILPAAVFTALALQILTRTENSDPERASV